MQTHLFAALFMCGIGLAIAKPAAFLNRVMQTSEGLPGNNVDAVAQDPDGFIWLATGNGVTRFDGVRFEVFNSDHGLPHNQVLSLHIEPAGRIWAGTRGGVAVREKGRWRIPDGLPKVPIWNLGGSKDGAVWIGTERGCWQWKDEKAVVVHIPAAIPDIRGFLDDGERGMWILTRSELCLKPPGAPAALVPGPWSGRDLREIARDPEGRLVLCGDGVLMREENGIWRDLAAGVEGGPVSGMAFATSPDGTLWLATRNRGLLFLRGGRWESYGSEQGLSLDDVRSLLIDREGLLWAGTNGGGVNRLRRRPFDVFGVHEGLGRTVASTLVEDRNRTVWVGTDGSGLFKLEGERFVPAFPDHRFPEDGLVWSLCTASDGCLWAGTFRDGVIGLGPEGVRRIGKAEGLPELWIAALQETRDGSLLIGMRNGALRKWSQGKLDPNFGGPDGGKVVISDILEDRQGRIWLAGLGEGLLRWEGKSWTWLSAGKELPGSTITTLHESADGTLWIGTAGNGLVRHRNGEMTAWSRKDGLISETIVQILEDQGGNLWLGTDSGLQRVSPGELEAQLRSGRKTSLAGLRLGRDDGLPTPQFSGEHGNPAVRTADGALWFSLAAGVIRVNPGELPLPLPAPVVRIESAAADQGELWNSDSPDGLQKVIIPPGSGTLQIRFTSPGFTAPDRLRFRYRLAGLENGWQESEGRRHASYPSLPPGDYRFEVGALNHEGGRSIHPAALEIRVMPYYWQSLPFRIGIAVGVLAISGIVVRRWSLRRMGRKMAWMEQERRVDQERARIAHDLHDELGASLTEINFLGTLAADSLPSGGIKERVDGMVDRARHMATALDEIVWTVNPANDTLASTAHYLCSRARESLATAGIHCRLDVDQALPDITLDSHRRHHLLMVVNEAVNNSMKHAAATALRLSVHFRAGVLRVEIGDDGCGFDPAKVLPGRNGLTNMRRRMESVGGSCHIQSGPDGTLIRLELPLN